jgi:hypothetical protein
MRQAIEEKLGGMRRWKGFAASSAERLEIYKLVPNNNG